MPLICVTRRIFQSNFNCNILASCSGSYFYSTTAREARFLKKLMVGTSKSKRKWFTVDQTPAKALRDFNFLGGSVVSSEKRQKSGKVTRRVNVLNTVFMEQITSLLATGDAGIDVFGLGLEISKVQMSPDFSSLHIYWYTNGSTERDNELATVLERTGFTLRHKLSQLRVIGFVPPIKFMKDDQYSKIVEVERLLQIADYGDDFTPTAIGQHLKTPRQVPVVPSSTLSHGIREKIKELETSRSDGESEGEETESSGEESDNEETDDIYSDGVMRQDILGLNHALLMSKVTEALKRVRYRKNPEGENPLSPSELGYANVREEPTLTGEEALKQIRSDKIRTIEFLNFLKTRRVEKAKEYKRLSAESNEREFYEAEMFERSLDEQTKIIVTAENKFFEDQEEDEDFVDEEKSEPRI